MKKIILVSLVLIGGLLSDMNFAQENNSIQFNGGIMFARRSSDGASFSMQYNYLLSSKINLYFSAGYSFWDKFNVTYREELNPPQRQEYFKTYNEDNHSLIPLIIGAKYNFHSNKFFTSFIIFEAGYSHLSYNSYNNIQIKNLTTGEVIAYDVDLNSKKENSYNLFNIGIGSGLSHSLSQSLDVILSFKINSNFNGNEIGFLSTKGTYSAWQLGLNVKI